jgi:hypothetical protein
VRLRFGVAMPLKGGRPAMIGVEVLEARGSDGKLQHTFRVGRVERFSKHAVEAARARVAAVMDQLAEHRPCAIIDVGSPQGLALHQSLRGSYDKRLHRSHAYRGTGTRGPLFSAFLQAYSAGRVAFAPGLDFRSDLDRALVFYGGQGAKKDGVDLSSEDEALVIALGLAMTWPMHGPTARKPETLAEER